MRWKLNQKPKAIALLMTLVILTLITIFMTEFFYDTTLHTRSIQNFQSSFRARTAVKSMFKTVLVAIQEDETTFFDYMKNIQLISKGKGLASKSKDLTAPTTSLLDPPLPIPLPPGILPGFDEDIILYTPYIRPIDHLFNLNRIKEKNLGTPEDQEIMNEFITILTQIPIEIPSKETPSKKQKIKKPPEIRNLTGDEVLPLYGALFDWMDRDDIPYQNTFGTFGAESGDLIATNPTIEIKNRPLDQLSEILLVPGIRDSGISYDEWHRYFTVYDVGIQNPNKVGIRIEPRINVNLANAIEIENFLKRFNEQTVYFPTKPEQAANTLSNRQQFVDRASEIAELLTHVDEEKGRKPFKEMMDVEKVLEALGTSLPRNMEKEFFVTYSQWYEIRLIAEVNSIQAEIHAILQVQRDQGGKAKPGGTEIKYFVLR